MFRSGRTCAVAVGLILLVSLVLFGSASLAGAILVDEGFENGVDGATLGYPWVLSGTPTHAEYDNAVSKHGQMSAWLQPGPTGGGFEVQQSTGMATDGAEERFWLYFDTVNQTRFAYDNAWGMAGERTFYLGFSNAGQLRVRTERAGNPNGYTSGTLVPVGTYATGWSQYRVVYNFTNQTYQLSTRRSLSDSWTQLKAAGASTYDIPFRGANTITTSHGAFFSAGLGVNVWLDDYEYSEAGLEGDTIPPAPPATLTAVDHPDDNGTAIDLSWPTPTDNVGVVGYKLLRGTSPFQLDTIVPLSGAVNSYTDSACAPNQTYYYRIQAVDAAGNESLPSAQASAVAISNVVVPAQSRISGQVTDKATGNPLSGITVTPWKLLSNGNWQSLPSTTTKAAGAYEFTFTSGGKFRLQFVDSTGTYRFQYYRGAVDMGSARYVIVKSGQHVSGVDEAMSTPAGRIEGKVIDAVSGNPIPGPVVGTPFDATNYGSISIRTATGSWSSVPGVTFQANQSGEYSVRGLVPGRYRLKFFPPFGNAVTYYKTVESGNAPAAVRVMAGQTTAGVDISAPGAPARLMGTVVNDQTGDSIPGVRVWVYEIDPVTGVQTVLTGNSPVTSWSGQFEVPNLEAKRYAFQFKHDNEDFAPKYVALEVASSDPVEIRMAPTATISGTVASRATGTPLANIEVWAYEYSNGVYSGRGHVALTDSNGTYAVRGIGGGTYRVLFRDKNTPAAYASAAYDGAPGIEEAPSGTDVIVADSGSATGIDALLDPAGSISGAVTDASTGEPLGGITVQAYREARGLWRPESKITVLTDSDGTYSIGGLSPGSYRMRFSDSTNEYRDRYYPAQDFIESASDIVLGAESRSDIDCSLVRSSTGDATGTVEPASLGDAAGLTLANGVSVAFDDAGDGGAVSARPVSVLERGEPSEFNLVGRLLEISTDVPFDGQVTVSVPYNPATIDCDPQNLKLYHYENGAWVDITTQVDTTNHVVSGQTESFSPFGVMAPDAEPGGGVEEPPPVVSTPASSWWSLGLGVALVLVVARRRTNDSIGR